MDQANEIPSFFCVPDITGFTKLIANADINFTKEIIPEVLRKLIDNNILKMNVAEIEGDAIFFYRTGRLPTITRVIQQCILFYDTFSKYIQSLQKVDEKNYNKHLSGGQLGLKIIIHYGQINTSFIKGRTKLIGQDVIIVHKLLKNSIPDMEYILFTKNYLKRIKTSRDNPLFDWKNLKKGKEVYEFIGTVKYRYIKLDTIKHSLSPDASQLI
ncbi:MAG TPA: DUF2652 domain-containing protein [Sphingobacteriaceae bacterium]|nr:DUF2652 domain-containing protein [Sphingobacteriaceae bacterium]